MLLKLLNTAHVHLATKGTHVPTIEQAEARMLAIATIVDAAAAQSL